MSKPSVGYWDIRGLAQPIRLLLAYLNIDFEDVCFQDADSWFSKKFEMGLDFPNVSFVFNFVLKLFSFLFWVFHDLDSILHR